MPHSRINAWWWLLALAALSLIALAVLQFRWIESLSEAERDRTQAFLRGSAVRIAEQFDDDVERLFRALQSAGPLDDEELQNFAEMYGHGELGTLPRKLVSNIYATSGETLLRYDPDSQQFTKTEWPERMGDLLRRLNARAAMIPPRAEPLAGALADPVPLIVLPRVRDRRPPPGPRPPDREGPEGRREGPEGRPPREGPEGPLPFDGQQRPPLPVRRPLRGWLMCELNMDFVRSELLPFLIERHLGTPAGVDYNLQLITDAEPHRLLFSSDSAVADRIMDAPDVTYGLFQVRNRPLGPGGGRPLRGEPGESGRREPRGAWQLLARHKAGSVDLAIASIHRRNVALAASSLALLTAAFALLIISNRRAQRLARQQVEFVAGVTHELRTPLTVICAAAENLVDGVVVTPERVQKYGLAIKKEGGRLVEVVEKIFRFARLETGRSTYKLEPTELKPVIGQAIAACEAEGVDPNSVEVTIPSDLGPVMADQPTLSHCLRNLISNAWKYGGEHKRIRIRATSAGRMARIEVEDDGIGIESPDLRHVFEPFYRGRAAMDNQIGGAGLGLTLVKGIVQGHRGKIEVSSTPGKGSRFTIVLPRATNGAKNSTD